MRRRLEAVGFEEVACYWPRPDPSRGAAAVWLPLDSPGAVRFVLTERTPPRNAVRRLGRAVRRGGRLLRPHVRLAVPVCATARKPSPGSELEASERTPREIVRSGWRRWGFGSPERLSWLLLTGGRRSLNKAVALVFDGAIGEPRLAVKMTRIPESVPPLSREAAVLASLHARPGGVRGAPEILFCERYGELLAVGETATVGVPLFNALREDNFEDLARKGADWLVALAGRPKVSPPETWRGRLIDAVVARFEKNFGSVVDPGFLREAQESLGLLGALPLVCEQRDFSPWNVLLTADGELAVLDWESSEPEGLPACDLIYFLAHLAFTLDRAGRTGRFRDSYRAALDRSSRTGSITAECLSEYAGRLDLPLSAIRPLRLLVWMLHSASDYEHLLADVAGTPGPEALRHSLFVNLWKEELRHGDGDLKRRAAAPATSRGVGEGS